MVSIITACRQCSRLSARKVWQDANMRGFRTSAIGLVAQNFTMPALSPTMTEGNIARWNVKEGDSFSAGDVLLEIETDKASMDVEAQDDGVVAKIFQGDGSKGIKVGTRIGVFAEVGDDLDNLEISSEKKSSGPVPEKDASKDDFQAPPREEPSNNHLDHVSETAKKQTYSLLPSVEYLMRLHNLNHATIDKMTPTGPNNRLLKGDVLAYLGKVSESYPSELSRMLHSLSHLDLSNIKVASSKSTSEAVSKQMASAKDASNSVNIPTSVKVELSISLDSMHRVQERIKNTLGVSLPDSTLISRAAKVANQNFPRTKSHKATSAELFDDILGIKTSSKSRSMRAQFSPQTRVQQRNLPKTSISNPKELDIIDFLSGRKLTGTLPPQASKNSQAEEKSLIFSLEVQKADEEGAQIFLGRIKNILENEPASLLL
ncbi:pyruvate dehydrogenase protein x component [Blumeria hordei DH14]|uniref:Pyruvate dehydrogenase protein x component n=1 Tax=Blumeria graminis f. sp. hordei (strain DH14) TaxID=546991 RepID=N1JKG8_BLUG1|nr:pyruvate dehydrogenase protein x component [Blumeria hordei DH14]